MEHWLNREMAREQKALLKELVYVASKDGVIEAVGEANTEKLHDMLLPFLERVRLLSGESALSMQFQLPEAVPFYHTWGLTRRNSSEINSSHMVVTSQQDLKAMSGIVLTESGPIVEAVSPIVLNRELMGSVSSSRDFEYLFNAMNLPRDYGLMVILNPEVSQSLDSSMVRSQIGKWSVIDILGHVDLTGLNERHIQPRKLKKLGNTFLQVMEINDFSGRSLGSMLFAYDAQNLLSNRNATVLKFSIIAALGAFALWFLLYYNVKRIRDFLHRLKRIIIASHSNDFADRFVGDSVHCLEVLNCSNTSCPVYRDPTLVCYLETGSEAISPRWRNTCVFLNKYKDCSCCPVYQMRHGDEIMEMRHVVNTMMRLWANFLNQIGGLLAEVLRTSGIASSQPSLDQVSKYLSEMARMTHFSHDLQGVYDQQEVFRNLDYVFSKHFGFTNFSLLLVNNSENRMELSVDRGLTGHRGVLLNAELCRANRAAEEVNSLYNPELCPYFSIDPEKEVRCCLPMVMGGRVGAVFTLAVPKDEWGDVQGKLPLISKYLDETAPVLSSLRLLQLTKDQALRDPLTHSHNRRFLDEYLSQYEHLTQREDRKVGFLMADLDHFKMVNDKYGHQSGDMILKQVVEIFRSFIRRSDLLVRYGGEEFLILLLEIEQGDAETVAEKIRMGIEEAEFTVSSGEKIKKTLSIGVAEFPDDADVLYKAIKFADVALYEAKNQGRNKVVRFRPEMWTDAEY